MESSVDLKMGDVVMLKSGGPKMTIVNISSPLPGSISSAKWVRCIWFDGNNIYEYRFDSTVLVKASDRTSPPKSR